MPATDNTGKIFARTICEGLSGVTKHTRYSPYKIALFEFTSILSIGCTAYAPQTLHDNTLKVVLTHLPIDKVHSSCDRRSYIPPPAYCTAVYELVYMLDSSCLDKKYKLNLIRNGHVLEHNC